MVQCGRSFAGMSNETFFRLMVAAITVTAASAWAGRGVAVDSSVATRTMQDSGYSDVRVVDRWDWLSDFNGCDSGDATAFEVVATRDGRPVRAYVCSGYPLKGATVRLK